MDIRGTFARRLSQIAGLDPRVVVVLNDSLSSSGLAPFVARHPQRVFNVGIAEQNQVGFAAGLAASGLVPWVSSATCFLSYRALEQIKNDLVYSCQNVKLVGNTTGIDYGPLGATHHSLEDLGVLRALPGLAVVIPADHEETAQAVEALHEAGGPAYLRLYRAQVPVSLGMPGRFTVGMVRVLRQGSECSVFAMGPMVGRALQAAKALEDEGVSVGVVNVSTLNPFDAEGVAAAASQSRFCVTVEEHAVQGGLGGAVCEALAALHPLPVVRMGFDGAFSIPGPSEELRAHYGLTAAGIAARIRALALGGT